VLHGKETEPMTVPPTVRAGSMVVPTILLLVGGIAFGSLFSANKIAVEAGFPVFAYAFWQALLCGSGLLIVAALLRDIPRLNAGTLKLFGTVAVTGLVIPLLVFTSVADKVPPGVLTLIVALCPVTTYVLSLILGMDRFRWLSMAGVMLGFGGILLIVLPSGSLPTREAALWVVFALLVPLSAAVNNIAGERFTPAKGGAPAIAGGMMTLAALILFVVMLAHDGPFLLTEAGPKGLTAVLWAAAGQAVTWLSFFEIVRRAGAVFFALLNYVVVAAGLIWANLLFDERLNLWVWLAVGVLAISLALINLGTARARRERQSSS
jgi:drug/metabolite transporter (DMT)-like permease